MNRVEKSNAVSPVVAILSIALTFILSIFILALVVLLFGYGFGLVFGELFLIVIPLGYMLYKRVDVGSYIGVKVTPKIILLGLAFGALLFLYDVAATGVTVTFFGESETIKETNSLVLGLTGSFEGLLSLIISLSLTGFCEEFAFRAFLQNAINSRYSTVIALLVSSLAFGLFHFDPQGQYVIITFLLGLALGYIYKRWHSYVISAISHSTLNLIILSIILLT